MNEHQKISRNGGSAGRGAAKARTSEQARAAAKTRWIKKEIREIEEIMKSDGYVFNPRLDDELRELDMQLAELKRNRSLAIDAGPDRFPITVRVDFGTKNRFQLYCHLTKLSQAKAFERLVNEARTP